MNNTPTNKSTNKSTRTATKRNTSINKNKITSDINKDTNDSINDSANDGINYNDMDKAIINNTDTTKESTNDDMIEDTNKVNIKYNKRQNKNSIKSDENTTNKKETIKSNKKKYKPYSIYFHSTVSKELNNIMKKTGKNRSEIVNEIFELILLKNISIADLCEPDEDTPIDNINDKNILDIIQMKKNNNQNKTYNINLNIKIATEIDSTAKKTKLSRSQVINQTLKSVFSKKV